jgi:hypothetical protein
MKTYQTNLNGSKVILSFFLLEKPGKPVELSLNLCSLKEGDFNAYKLYTT